MTPENMEKDALIGSILEAFSLKTEKASMYSPLALAYIGDNVYELVNRTVAVRKANRQVQKLHKECSGRARAATQARLIAAIEPDLTEEELSVYTRGRNAEVNTKAKNSTLAEYHHATGLEALIGYLYLDGQYERLVELIKTGWERINV